MRGNAMLCIETPDTDKMLTPRQVEVAQLAADGLTARQSAQRLGLSVRTVEAYLAAARKRVGAASTSELIAKTAAAGIFKVGADCFAEAKNETGPDPLTAA